MAEFELKNFNASEGWVNSCMTRYRISLSPQKVHQSCIFADKFYVFWTFWENVEKFPSDKNVQVPSVPQLEGLINSLNNQ